MAADKFDAKPPVTEPTMLAQPLSKKTPDSANHPTKFDARWR
jgi:hypothetical protein